MTAAQLVRVRLVALTALMSQLASDATRITVGIRSQKSGIGVLVQHVSQDEAIHLRGAGGYVRTRVQVDFIANSRETATALEAAGHGDGAGSGLSGFTGTVSSTEVHAILPDLRREGYYADDLRQFYVSRDYFVTWTP